MLFQHAWRSGSVLASVLAAVGIGLTVAGCSNLAPLGPTAPARKPTPHQAAVAQPVVIPRPSQLPSPIVMEAVRVEAPTRAGHCPAHTLALDGGPGRCYRKVGTPVTFTVAGVSPIYSSGSSTGVQDTFFIAVTSAEQSALTTVTTTAFDSHSFLDVRIAGRTWVLPEQVDQPFTQPQFEIALPNASQTLQLHRLLEQSG
jgi:hypothetical protein